MALGAYQAFMEEGLKVPEDIAIVGFNDIEFTRMKGIELTTIGQKKFEMGTLAVKTLVEKRLDSHDAFALRYLIASPTVEIFSASSSGI
jgi:LacI family transcriptional regulator